MYPRLAAWVFLASSLVAQETTSSGTALTPDNQPIPNATVTYKSKDGKIAATATTDKNGAFQVKVPAGQDYEVSIEADGMDKLVKPLMKSALEQLGKLFVKPKPKTAAVSLEEAEGQVRDSDGKPLGNAKVTLTGSETKQVTSVMAKDGKFSAKLPSETSYEIVVEAAGHAPVTLQMAKAGLRLIDVKLAKAEAQRGPFPVLFCCAVYWLVAMVARYHNIAQIDRANIRATLKGLTSDPALQSSESVKSRVTALTENASKLLDAAGGFSSYFLGFRGQEIAARVNICDARLILAEAFSRDRLLAELRAVGEFLRPEYSNIATKVEAVLATVTDTAPSTDFLRETHRTALDAANEKRERAFAAVSNWQNKAFALVFLGCVLLGALALVLDNPVLVFIGLLGGFASRLMRGKTTTNSTEASLSWTTLLLSPLYGGFAGWAGILILCGAKDLKLLGETFTPIVWADASRSTLALGLAFLFGFSERFFSAVTDMAENAITKQANASAADSPKAKPATGNPANGIPPASPEISGATLGNDRQSLKLTGTNLTAITKVTLDGPATAALEITAKTDTQVDAKAAQPLPAGNHTIWINGKDTGKTVGAA